MNEDKRIMRVELNKKEYETAQNMKGLIAEHMKRAEGKENETKRKFIFLEWNFSAADGALRS